MKDLPDSYLFFRPPQMKYRLYPTRLPPTAETTATARRLLEAGGHPTDIAKLLDLCRATIDKVARTYNIRTTSIPVDELKKLYEMKPDPSV